jgi:hypothetical protein
LKPTFWYFHNALVLTFWFWAVEARFTSGTVGGGGRAIEAWGTHGLTLVRVGAAVTLITHGARLLATQRVISRLTGNTGKIKSTLRSYTSILCHFFQINPKLNFSEFFLVLAIIIIH